MTRFSWLLPLVVLACFVPGQGLQAQDALFRPTVQAKDIDANLRTDWYGLYLKGTKTGWFKTTRDRTGDTITEGFVLNMKVVSMDIKATIHISQSLAFEGKPPYRLMGGTFTQDDGVNKVTIKAKRISDKLFEHTLSAAGQTQTRKVDDLGYSLSDAMASEIWIRGGPKVGDTILGKDLDLQEWKGDQTRYNVVAVKKSLVEGVEVKFYEIVGKSKKQMIELLSRSDSNGNLISGKIAGFFDLRKETEAEAKDTKFSLDLFVEGQAKIDKSIGDTRRLTELVLQIKGDVGDIFDDGPRQNVVKKPGGVSLLRTGKKFGKEVKATAKEIEEALAETTAYAVSNEKVKALAKKAVGDAKTPEEKVRRIVTFVKRYIAPNLTATLPNIHALIEDKKGDCKCYALLTANLCRAAGVPCREVSGLLYMGDDVKAFGGHAWNEVVLNGVWVPVDASLAQAEVDAGHLCMGTDQVAAKNMLQALGKLSFRVVEVQSK